jgi:hypothetical protein
MLLVELFLATLLRLVSLVNSAASTPSSEWGGGDTYFNQALLLQTLAQHAGAHFPLTTPSGRLRRCLLWVSPLLRTPFFLLPRCLSCRSCPASRETVRPRHQQTHHQRVLLLTAIRATSAKTQTYANDLTPRFPRSGNLEAMALLYELGHSWYAIHFFVPQSKRVNGALDDRHSLTPA